MHIACVGVGYTTHESGGVCITNISRSALLSYGCPTPNHCYPNHDLLLYVDANTYSLPQRTSHYMLFGRINASSKHLLNVVVTPSLLGTTWPQS